MLVAVGLGALAPAQVKTILESQDPLGKHQARVAPAHGLFLKSVLYGSLGKRSGPGSSCYVPSDCCGHGVEWGGQGPLTAARQLGVKEPPPPRVTVLQPSPSWADPLPGHGSGPSGGEGGLTLPQADAGSGLSTDAASCTLQGPQFGSHK